MEQYHVWYHKWAWTLIHDVIMQVAYWNDLSYIWIWYLPSCTLVHLHVQYFILVHVVWPDLMVMGLFPSFPSPTFDPCSAVYAAQTQRFAEIDREAETVEQREREMRALEVRLRPVRAYYMCMFHSRVCNNEICRLIHLHNSFCFRLTFLTSMKSSGTWGPWSMNRERWLVCEIIFFVPFLVCFPSYKLIYLLLKPIHTFYTSFVILP